MLTLLLFIGSQSFAKEKINFCHSALAENTNLSFTEIFFVYLQQLHSDQMVTSETLITLKTDLEKQSSLTNPVIKNTSDYEVHAAMVHDYLTSAELDQKLLLSKLIAFLKQQNEIAEDKKQSRKQTIIAYKKMKFNSMPKGSYTQVLHKIDNEINREEEVAVNYSFLIMDSLVSKYMWMNTFAREEFYIVGMKESDETITGIQKSAAAHFANKLSKLHNLKPAYKFKRKTQINGDILETSYLDEPNNDVTKIEGYRLPTWQELGLIRTNYGEVKTSQVLPNITRQNVHQYANKDGKPVSELSPVIIKGEIFYDLYNGFEITENYFAGMDNHGGTPVSAYYSTPNATNLTCYSNNLMGTAYPNAGFRLVRTVHPGKKP